ncbi:patatin-like phospholipase family protein [Methylibium rhizosphaerae]|uniref:patatin-like phospholipase family protein n=1 Tax=Methylibium rhizosphaerae TaxID=2570323 RepID=UPI001C615AAF|nr:patatin-like phospholipase family protein [Methylibium rhizosphaerae]
MAGNRPEAGIEPKSMSAHYQRRREVLADKEGLSARPWGLALSGGGIRSATFCFGLLKALARNDLFRRFDILSTVSGGGYIGSAVGRLFHESGSTPERVQAALADAGTRPFGVWLRANGRYLIPRGTKDLIFAIANFGRNLVGIHIELAFLSLLLGGFLVGLDLVVWEWANCIFQSGQCWRPGWIDVDVLALLSGPPPIWLFLPFVAWVGTALACAYWVLPARKGDSWVVQPLVTAALAVTGIVLLVRHATSALSGLPHITGTLELPGELVVTAVALLLAWIAGIAIATCLAFSGKEQDRVRNRLTASLSVTLSVGLIVAGLGVADYLAWSIGNIDAAKQGTFGAALALAVVALRAALPKIADLPKSLTPGTRRSVLWLINIAGLLLLALVVIFWMSWVHRATSDVLFVRRPPELRFQPSYEALLWIVIPPVLLVLASLRNRDFLNRSSLFTFYRARLVRSYLGAANPGRFEAADSGGSCVDKARVGAPKVLVASVHAKDDVAMERYQPHMQGGPVHLINVCVNQTRDPRGGLFNQDRKGLLLTVGPNGQMCTTPNVWRFPQDKARLTLGSWMAISGAAVAPGLGSSTRSGVAAVLMLAGLRLGYWWDSLNFGTKPSEPPRRPVTKYEQFFSELRGRFDGDQGRDWFLSDGGHFENTAAYALLREECEVIVLADCGADPRYAFGDLENLVRKARIDLQADITFLRPKSTTEVAARNPDADTFGDSVTLFGSLNELASTDSQACLALARVTYGHSERVGHMVIVKPNMCHGVPVDLVNFKADNPLFPQEPTTDQFFSEAQWESYYQLGQTLGANISQKVLCNLAAFATQHFVDDDGAMLVTDAKGEQSVQYSSKRLSSRIAATGAVSASVSLGAVTTIGLASWDAVNKELSSMSLASRIEPGTYKELTDIFGKLSPVPAGASAPDARLGEMATALLRVGDAVCNPKNLAAFRQSELMALMVARTKQACRDSAAAHASCSALLNDDKVSACLQDKPRVACVPTYWTRDYKTDATKPSNCWDPAALPIQDGVDMASSAMPPARPVSEVASAASATVTGQAPKPIGERKSPVCTGKTIYLQIYGPELRDSVRLLREPWRALGASVPPVEDVWDSARRAGRRLPQPYQVPTVIYQHEASKLCAEALQPDGALPPWQVRPVPAGMAGRHDVIEVWVPPVGQNAGQAAPAEAFCYQEDDRNPGPQRYSVHCHATQEACVSARGENTKRVQTECRQTSLTPGAMAFSRGWAGSWYASGPSAFGAPFPSLPDAK